MLFFSCSSTKQMINHNPELKTIQGLIDIHPLLKNWSGTPYNEDGRFVNIDFKDKNDPTKVLKWQLSKNPQKEEKLNDKWVPQVDRSKLFLSDKSDGITWLGHATFLVNINGKRLITDPVFGNVTFVKRLQKFQFNPSELKNIDYILLSHDHADHFNKESLELLIKNNPGITILAGLRTEELLRDWFEDLPNWNIQTAGWYQQFKLTNNVLEIYFLPARHWSRRGVNDENYRLWGSFIIKNNEKTIYYAGDSGIGNHFEITGKLFPNIDVAMIGIGAYSPKWFMQKNHTSPDETVEMFNKMKAKSLFPMHFGAFDLADEPQGEPYRLIKKLESEGKINGKLIEPTIGKKHAIYF